MSKLTLDEIEWEAERFWFAPKPNSHPLKAAVGAAVQAGRYSFPFVLIFALAFGMTRHVHVLSRDRLEDAVAIATVLAPTAVIVAAVLLDADDKFAVLLKVVLCTASVSFFFREVLDAEPYARLKPYAHGRVETALAVAFFVTVAGAAAIAWLECYLKWRKHRRAVAEITLRGTPWA